MLQETEGTLLAEDMKSKLQAAGWTNIRLTTLRELAKTDIERALKLHMRICATQVDGKGFLLEDSLQEKVRHFIDFSTYRFSCYVTGISLSRLDTPLVLEE